MDTIIKNIQSSQVKLRTFHMRVAVGSIHLKIMYQINFCAMMKVANACSSNLWLTGDINW